MQRLIVVASLAALVPACSGKSAEPEQVEEVPAAQVNTEAAKADEAKAMAARHEAGDHEGCIYAEGERDTHDPSCPGGHGEPGAVPEGDGHFGQAFALAEAMPLAQAIEGGAPEGPVQVRGEVEAVCQKKGCWMVIKDGVASARVMMKGHGFAVPMDSRGKKALVEGTLSSRTFTEAQVKHLEKDAGKDPGAVGGERTEHVLTATGVEIKS